MDKKPLIGNEPEPESKPEDPMELFHQIFFFQRVIVGATSRRDRVSALMQRKSSKQWDAAKKAKMVRRLMTANKELEEATVALDQLNQRIVNLTAEHKRVNNVAPFVPGPASTQG